MSGTPLQEYRVEWAIPTLSSSPEEAARKAVNAVANREFNLNVCTVLGADGEATEIDLNALVAAFYLNVKISNSIDLARHISELDYGVIAPAITDTEIMGADFAQRTIKVKCSLGTPLCWDSILRVTEHLDYHVTTASGESLDTEILEVTED